MFIDRSDPDGGNPTPMQNIGIIVAVTLCGLPALSMNGFFFDIKLPLIVAIMMATVGGVIAGALICSDPILAGLVGGFIGGPISLLVLYFYSAGRQEIYTVEIVIVQAIGALPGIGVGWVLKKLLGSSTTSAPVDYGAAANSYYSPADPYASGYGPSDTAANMPSYPPAPSSPPAGANEWSFNKLPPQRGPGM